MTDIALTTEGIPTQKKGCGGCFVWGCLLPSFIFVLLLIGGSVAIWYGVKDMNVPDKAVVWTYEYVARPKIEELIPPNLPEAEKQQILKMADFGMERYRQLPSEQKSILLKEALIAAYYYNNKEIIPLEKVPNLMKFIQEVQQTYPGPKPPNFPP